MGALSKHMVPAIDLALCGSLTELHYTGCFFVCFLFLFLFLERTFFSVQKVLWSTKKKKKIINLGKTVQEKESLCTYAKPCRGCVLQESK